ncbi:hypothetical protein [Limnoglobus roseus]|uniref:Uncharacterized protein n=1 Tax=Limnoglobus roseus TaxID=2598579 RepID=A0A5C1AQD7_9BACT|nr:hypothetical protein [Limnoglobus roseus]QEL19962.1 hypothetical protein PX52LOC_07045 [Limnoglobus roseus]
MLDAADVPLKVRQTILRHSDPRLTMNRYTKLTTAAAGEAIDALPSVFSASTGSANLYRSLQGKVMAGGADDNRRERPVC